MYWLCSSSGGCLTLAASVAGNNETDMRCRFQGRFYAALWQESSKICQTCDAQKEIRNFKKWKKWEEGHKQETGSRDRLVGSQTQGR
ncbi:hypothetical protein W02_10890 [Nitrospira sp. KM1]|nr:hypothetical protein W02_10890 [Nitrospira sp. KM1]